MKRQTPATITDSGIVTSASLWMMKSWVVLFVCLRERMPSIGALEGLRSGPLWTSWSPVESCTCGGAISGISTDKEMNGLRQQPCRLRDTVDKKSDLSWQCVIAAQKASFILDCVKRSVTSRFALLLWDPTWHTESRSGTLSTWISWSRSREGQQKWSNGWHTSPCEERLKEL